MVLRGRIPRLIVFDCDHTLWPFGVDNFKFKPPYHKIDGQVFDSENKQMKCFPEVPQVLKILNDNGFQLAAASRTKYPEGVHSLIDLFGWDSYIKFREIYPGSKRKHFDNFKINSGIMYKQMLFFDDETRNIDDIKPLGVMAVLVDREVGITRQLIDKSLEEYSNISKY